MKDHGGFVAGALKGGRRKVDTVELRSMVALDGDRIDKTAAYTMRIKRLFRYTTENWMHWKTSSKVPTGSLSLSPTGFSMTLPASERGLLSVR